MDVSNDDLTQTTPNSQDQEAAKRQGLVTVNDLNYTLEPDLSVAVNRTGKKHFFQSTEYLHNQQGICILNSGADFVDTRTSYLSFEVEIPSDGADVSTSGYFGAHGSACNLIDTLTISTRSGDELCRLTEFGLLQNMLIPIQYNGDWIQSVGSLMGFGGKVNTPESVEYISGGRKRFIIPMYILAPREPYVYVAIKDMCEGNLVSSDGSQYNILAVVELTNTPYGSYRGFDATDLKVDDVSFLDNINIHTADIMILDKRFRPLYVPLNHHVAIVLKAFWNN